MQRNIKTIIKALSDGNYHSGADLGNILGLTRGAIWKLIKQLKKYDIEIEAKTNLGYRIPGGIELLIKKDIISYLNGSNQKHTYKIEILDEVDSTNAYLMDLDRTKKNSTNICFAEYQIAGRGRLGRDWFSPFAKNIYLSVLWQFAREPHELSGLGLVVAVAIVEALKKYGIKEDLSLKWPNDVLWQNRKLSGILIDLFGEANHFYNAIIGIGLNVEMPEKAKRKINQPWCDVSQIIKSKPERNKLAGLLLNEFVSSMSEYQVNGLAVFMKKWRKLDVTYGKKVTIITTQKKINGVGCGVDKNGYFLLKNSRGEIQSFASGEVSLRF